VAPDAIPLVHSTSKVSSPSHACTCRPLTLSFSTGFSVTPTGAWLGLDTHHLNAWVLHKSQCLASRACDRGRSFAESGLRTTHHARLLVPLTIYPTCTYDARITAHLHPDLRHSV